MRSQKITGKKGKVKGRRHMQREFMCFTIFIIFICSFLKLLFRYSCLHFHPTMPPPPHPSSPPTLESTLLWLCPYVLYTFSLMVLLLFSPNIPVPCPLWLLSVCSLFQFLWFYFVCLFVWFIRFHLQVRSYGICFSPPGLFHLP